MKFRPRMTKCFVNETPVLNPIISHRLSKASFVPSFFQSERVRQMKKVSLGWFRDAAFCWFFFNGVWLPWTRIHSSVGIKRAVFHRFKTHFPSKRVLSIQQNILSASQVEQDDGRGSSFWFSQSYTPKPLGSLRCFYATIQLNIPL